MLNYKELKYLLKQKTLWFLNSADKLLCIYHNFIMKVSLPQISILKSIQKLLVQVEYLFNILNEKGFDNKNFVNLNTQNLKYFQFFLNFVTIRDFFSKTSFFTNFSWLVSFFIVFPDIFDISALWQPWH